MKQIGTLNYYGLTIYQYETDEGYKFYQLQNPLQTELKLLGVNNLEALEVVGADKGATTECFWGRHILPKLTPHPEDTKLYKRLQKYEYFELPKKYENINKDYQNSYEWNYQAIEKDGKWGICDNTGKLIIPLQYDYCEVACGFEHKQGIIIGNSGKKAFVVSPKNIKNAEWYDDIVNCHPDFFITHRDGKVGLISIDGWTMIPCDADIIFDNDQSSFTYLKNNKWGFVFFSQELKKYVSTDELYDNFKGWHDFKVQKGKKWGYINCYGEFTTCKRERTGNFWLLGPYYFIAKQWSEVKPFTDTFPELDIPANGSGLASKKTNAIITKYKKHLESLTPYDSNEFNILETKLSNYEKSLNWSPGIFERNGKYGIKDVDGKLLLPAIFDEIKERPTGKFSHYTPAIVRDGKYWGLRSLSENNEVILPSQYEDIIYKGVMTGYEVITNGKHGLVDFNGDVKIPSRMDLWVEKSEWLLFVMVRDNKIGFYNHYGLYVEPFYDKFIVDRGNIFAQYEDNYEYWELSTQSPTCYKLKDDQIINEIKSRGFGIKDVEAWYREQEKNVGNGDNLMPGFIKVVSDSDLEKLEKGEFSVEDINID